MEDNPYLALRAAKIARNEARLQELGLTVDPKATSRRGTKRKVATPVEVTPPPRTQPLRRSSRRKDKQDDKSTQDVIELTQHLPRPKKKAVHKNNNGARKPPVIAPGSVRGIHISLDKIMDNFLGKQLETTGKASVISASLDGRLASFNKYSGVQEWGGNVIYLWINMGKKDDDVVNTFVDGGRKITWFGGSRMHDETPVIEKLIRIGQSRTNEKEGIVLWLRHYNAAKKTYYPYTCLGRLRYESHVPGSRPLQFVWNLCSYDSLVSHSDPSIKNHFGNLRSL